MPERLPSDFLSVAWDRSSSRPTVQPTPSSTQWFPGAHQTICVWCRGFIANAAGLLGEAGLPAGTPDGELLLSLYRKYGDGVAQRITGPFAWILWDGDSKKLVAARDRMGIYGLYYSVSGQTVQLANRVEAILPSVQALKRLNPLSIVAHINGEAPLEGETFYENIRAVKPGEILTVTGDTLGLRQYWRIRPLPTLKLASDAAYSEAFQELLFQVIAEWTPSGQVGVTVSSGIDSTTVAAAVRKVFHGTNLIAVSWIAPELPDADESTLALTVCRYLNLPCVTIRADLAWPLSAAQGMRTSAATPLRNYYSELWDLTFQETKRQGITTLFSGLGGDHLFGGNVLSYPDLLLTGRWLELARQIRCYLAFSEMDLVQLTRSMVLRPAVRAYIPGRRSAGDPVPWLAQQYHRVYKEYFSASDRSWRQLPGKKQRLKMLRDRLLPSIAERANLHAAEYDIDLRHPLLDHRLVDFASALPAAQTFRCGKRKAIVRDGMRGYLPDEVLELRRRIYPASIGSRGLRERERTRVWALITNMRAADLGFVDERALQQAYRMYLAGERDSDLFWHSLTLEDWLRRYH